MQKAKKEDFRVEEDLRAQKAKYEESSEDVYRRMEDIKESEVDSVADLTQFLESELSYHEGCRNILLELRKNWPAQYVEENNTTFSAPK
jgi:BAR domain